MIAIIDYSAGNVRSVQNALSRLGAESKVTQDAREIARAEKVIFPGVGEASSAMDSLKKSGLDSIIPQLKQPVLGICLGMQLMCNWSEEGNTQGLGIFEHSVNAIPTSITVPHMGWNAFQGVDGALFRGIAPEEHVFFVHGFAASLGPHTSAISSYPKPFSAALERANFYAVQFHPEKSGAVGQRILQNFLAIC